MATRPPRRRTARLLTALQVELISGQQPSAGALDGHDLIQSIQSRTALLNRNNLTRTAAYWDFYVQYPEVHWALLAHVVSRNAGYGMTDLRGEWFSRISTAEDATHFFAFLERANWLIFQDAYPQLLLYAESKRQGQNFAPLLPLFGVSRFMVPIWDLFLETGDSSLLTRGLIINEQHYIESRVLQNKHYHDAVVRSVQFQAQSLFNLNEIVIPFGNPARCRLAGTSIRRFTSVDDRIWTGLKLYETIFPQQNNRAHVARPDIVRWMGQVPHRGSRSDYWPDFFISSADGYSESGDYVPRFLAHAPIGRKLYSPQVSAVWADVAHEPAKPGDWFTELSPAIHLVQPIPTQPRDNTKNYIASVQMIERLLLVKQQAVVAIPIV